LEKLEELQLHFVDEALESLEVDSDQSLDFLVSMESLVVDSVAAVAFAVPTAAVVTSAASAAAESSAFAAPTAAAASELTTDSHPDLVVAAESVAQPSDHTYSPVVMQFVGTAAGPQLLI
jgi:hypothetical protein